MDLLLMSEKNMCVNVYDDGVSVSQRNGYIPSRIYYSSTECRGTILVKEANFQKVGFSVLVMITFWMKKKWA